MEAEARHRAPLRMADDDFMLLGLPRQQGLDRNPRRLRLSLPAHCPHKRAMRPLFLGLAGLLLVSASDPAPAPIIAKPALWKVADADTTIYLFGTIHMLKPGTRWFDGKIRTAFDSSQELVIEMIEPAPGDAQRIVISHAIDPDGPPLTSKLTPADAEKYRAALHSAGLAAESYEQFQPWFVSTLVALLPMQKLGYDPSIGAEKTLVAEAKKAQKKLGALETMEQQIGFFANLPEAQQIRFLNSAVRELPEADKSADRMVGDWAKGQPDKLARVLRGKNIRVYVSRAAGKHRVRAGPFPDRASAERVAARLKSQGQSVSIIAP